MSMGLGVAPPPGTTAPRVPRRVPPRPTSATSWYPPAWRMLAVSLESDLRSSVLSLQRRDAQLLQDAYPALALFKYVGMRTMKCRQVLG